MRAAPCGLDFSTPLAPRAQAEAAAAKDERIQAELLEIGQVRSVVAPYAGGDRPVRSTLCLYADNKFTGKFELLEMARSAHSCCSP